MKNSSMVKDFHSFPLRFSPDGLKLGLEHSLANKASFGRLIVAKRGCCGPLSFAVRF
ncbi:hypothetical protein DPMN_096861 [Dreissena polymorpha]|uniref:Uncharacterized protein n=1 Tax=Dreissena polymorpha TaxID=45954 RepID=A0A9D4R468_DREPO|nr:hypothetical protein DPMN_096861 [Dreissena polymorpha]